MRYIGIDYGTKKTGIAFSDEAGRMGFPHGVKTTDAKLLDDLTILIREKEVGGIVFGESKNFSGGENDVALQARAFAEDLHSRTNVPVHFEPETFTTQAARRFPDGTRMEGSPDVDASAAALILTSFLERMQDAQAAIDNAPEPVPADPIISIDDFAKVVIKVGTVISAERVPETVKLLRLMVDLGEAETRQIVSGISAYTNAEDLVGRQLSFVTNLAPRKIKGLESNGMLFAVGEGESFAFVIPDRPVPPGTGAH